MILIFKRIYLLLGIPIGIWHFYLGTLSIFLFREKEPLLSWLMIISGPILTLPLVLIGLRKPSIAAWCLFGGAILSLLSMVISEGLNGEHVAAFALIISGPMFLLGLVCLIRQKMELKSQPTTTDYKISNGM